eukprot:5171611-Heterocapsa_arctica.AAC.1
MSDLREFKIAKIRVSVERSALPPQMVNPSILFFAKFYLQFFSILCALLGVQTPSARMVCSAHAFIGSFWASFWSNLRVVASSTPLSTPL